MDKETLGIDLDEVLNTLHTEWLDQYNKDFKDNLKPEEIRSWEITEWIKPEAKPYIFDYLAQPNFFYNLGVKPHAQEVTKWLSNYYDLYVVTAYHYDVCRDKVKWVEKYFHHIDVKNIIFCNNKGLIKTKYLIDDGGHNCEDFTGIPILFNASYNQYLGDKYVRVNDWLDIREYFKKKVKSSKERIGVK